MRFSMLFLLMGVLATGCKKDDEASGCNGICTADVRSIQLRVEDADGGPVLLDSVVTVNLMTGRAYKHPLPPSLIPVIPERYLVLADGEISKTGPDGLPFRFQGYRQRQLVVQHTMRIGHGCCHVFLPGGGYQDTVLVP